MKQKLVRIIALTTGTLLLNACHHQQPVKTLDYFKNHPEEIQTEAQRCAEDVKYGKSIAKDESCTNVAVIASERCIHQRNMMGAANFIDINCDDPDQMLALAVHGY